MRLIAVLLLILFTSALFASTDKTPSTMSSPTPSPLPKKKVKPRKNKAKKQVDDEEYGLCSERFLLV